MVAKITVPNSIKRALNYNENKVKEGKAKCIYARNFLKSAANLNFHDKLNRFEQLIVVNTRAVTNTIHVSLNFALNEKLEREKLAEIAKVYMDKIGFGDQPFLVYQHFDAGHPHIHIVSTNIKDDGKRISLHNLGRIQSSKAREEIEREFNLVRAKNQQKESNDITPLHPQRITYGKSVTKRAITNVLDAVIPHYKYTSIAELNAILQLYNLSADRGKEEGVIFKNNGLTYRVLDEKGNKIGIPIKASSIYSKPTLSFLEKKFKENEPLKQEHKRRLKTSIDWLLLTPPKNISGYKQALEKEKISLVIRQNEQGFIYGLTYIDHHTKCVFNGSDVGKPYTAKGIMEKLNIEQGEVDQKKINLDNSIEQRSKAVHMHPIFRTENVDLGKMMTQIISPTEEADYVPYDLRKRRKKKKNRS